jgi:methanogenic corrinoid protein MtbC1
MTGMDRQCADWTGESTAESAHASLGVGAADASWVVTSQRDRLLRTIEGEIIPRLVLAHRGRRPIVREATRPFVADESTLSHFVALLAETEAAEASAFVDGLLADRYGLESIYLNLFAPAARRLGDMWSADECDFTVVTLALWRLQRLLHDHAPQFDSEGAQPAECRRILLAPMPGEQHTFGLFMVAEFFRRDGWDVVDAPVAGASDLLALAARQWFDVIGLSLSCSGKISDMAELIRDLRRSSRNGEVGVMVGGGLFIETPALLRQVGADVSAIDARQALRAATDMLALIPDQSIAERIR